ncbi:MAG: four-carbon acid sugar kinase family protein [Sphaerochaeta sp.]|jgi:uncharacterized protein YgbK (DUF1537 family)|nr:four-carbon acid sugar kinase family protein [Sphaerochaeta sp.]
MARYLIIADDLTGANDTGLQLARRGIPTRVQIKGTAPIDESWSLVIDTESRNTDEVTAQTLMRRALATLALDSFSPIMKKIDSTLRGNIAAEVAVLRERIDASIVVVASAFPAMGRTCQEGVVSLNGVRLVETEAGRDVRKPIVTDDLSTLFAPIDPRIVCLSVETIRELSFPSLGHGIVICDALNQEDLDLVAAWALSLDRRVLFVGSAGLAEALANHLKPAKSALAVVASLSAVTEVQVRYAQELGAVLVPIPVQKILDGGELGQYIERATTLLDEGRDVVLTVTSVVDKGEVTLPDTLDNSDDTVSMRLVEALSEVGRLVIKQSDLAGLLLVGSDTAYGLLDALGIAEIEILREVALGIPMMVATSGPYAGLSIITKAGGFGKDDAISFALRALKEDRR